VRLTRVGAALRDIGAGKDCEQRGLAHLGQTDDSSLHIDIYRFRLRSLEHTRPIYMINERSD